MAKSKGTIIRDSVFRSTGVNPPPLQGIQSALPATRQTAVWLSDEETDWLDSRCREIRSGGWRSITRSAFIRALIRAAMNKPLELQGISGEAELTEHLATHR